MGNADEMRDLRKAKRKPRFQIESSERADWSQQNSGKVLDAIAVVSRAGGAIRLGYTRDGGAYSVGIYGDGDPYTVYLRPGDDIEALFDSLARDFANDQRPDQRK